MFEHHGEESEEQKSQLALSIWLAFGLLLLLTGCSGLLIRISARSVAQTIAGTAMLLPLLPRLTRAIKARPED